MDGPKDPANAAASAARRQDPTAKAHDEARREVKDLLDRRGNGEPPTTLRKRKGVYGCDIMRDKAPDHQHRLKDEAYCRELMPTFIFSVLERANSGSFFSRFAG